MANISDTERLDWLVLNNALVRSGGLKSPDPYYFVAFVSGETSDSRPTYREAIDLAIGESTHG